MDKIKKLWIKFLYSWSVFLSICIDPLVILSIITLSYLYNSTDADKPTPALIYILVTAVSTIFGVRITQKWSEITEGGIIKARGRTAVRSLKLLLGNISSLEQRIANFSDNTDQINNNPDVTSRNYEEIREKCLRLQEEVISSIENWTEFVPEADIKTQIGEITGVSSSLLNAEEELKAVTEELEHIKNTNNGEKDKLELEVKARQNEIKKLENELIVKNFKLGVNSYSSDPLGIRKPPFYDLRIERGFKEKHFDSLKKYIKKRDDQIIDDDDEE